MIREDQLILNVTSLFPITELMPVDYPRQVAEDAGYAGVMEIPRRRLIAELNDNPTSDLRVQYFQTPWIMDRDAEPLAGINKPTSKRMLDLALCAPWGVLPSEFDVTQLKMESLYPEIPTAINYNISLPRNVVNDEASRRGLRAMDVIRMADFSRRVKNPRLKFFPELKQSTLQLKQWIEIDPSKRKLAFQATDQKGFGVVNASADATRSAEDVLKNLLLQTETIHVRVNAAMLNEAIQDRDNGEFGLLIDKIETARKGLPERTQKAHRFVIETDPTQWKTAIKMGGVRDNLRKVRNFMLRTGR